jgi:hypothetical protein
LVADSLQYCDSAIDVDQEDSNDGVVAVCDFVDCECGDVARAICDRGGEFASGFLAVVVGDVLPDAVGLDDVYRIDWVVFDVAVFVHSLFAGDFDFGDAGFGGGGREEVKAGRTAEGSEAPPLRRHGADIST